MARAKYIVVLGPDGSGKTTIADQLAENLSENHAVRRLNFSFGIMPSISRALGRKEREAAPEGTLNAGMVRPLRPLKAVFLAVWYGIDHVLGHITLYRKPPGETVIFARSYHDFLYQRAYLNLPRIVPRFFLALGPKPNLVVTPKRDAAVIHDDKPELTIEEIEEQYLRIIGSLGCYQYFDTIDAKAGVEDTIRQIRERVVL